jgi:DNA-directed RNA polymerase subunit M/transcription elongation factor TFIIS
MARCQTLASFCRFVPPLLAHSLEHACQTHSLTSRTAYERVALRCLYLLEHGLIDEARLRELGALTVASVPLETIVHSLPAKEEILTKEEHRRKSAALLKDLTQGDSMMEAFPDSGLRCKKCGSNDITHEFLQTRSADEGTTIFCTCTSCKKRWKM